METQKMEDQEQDQPESYSCCGSESKEELEPTTTEKRAQEVEVRRKIREQYATIATSKSKLEVKKEPEESKEESSPSKNVTSYTDYSGEELSNIPKEANLNLGSGNPVKLANLQIGETVVDLGSGAGIDCFLAANKVGESGKVIGIDMTPQMIDKARINAKENNYSNVEFRLGEIEHMPLADNSTDVIVSNCVINLALDKSQVFKDAYRILKPGGRLVVSDIVLNYEFPEVVKKAIKNVPGCVSRAWVADDYLNAIKEAGFNNVELLESAIIGPQGKPQKNESGLRKRKLRTYNTEIEVELTPEEDEKLQKTVMKAHFRAYKPLSV
jgi:SAM-dependent methyltransferase